MRPISLEVEGFTSFRQRVSIDFSSLDLFAITGPTGSGKTSIIDAMTYALYGCTSRIGKQGISELISQGADRLKVLLEFACGSDRYRVARETKKTAKSASTELRFEQWDSDRWVSLADKVSHADQLVEKIIGLDFNGFTKSVVLPQGRFDDFLKGNPRDRRKILSDLLGLDVYIRMMKRANEIAQGHKGKAEFFENLLTRDYAAATRENLERVTEELESLKPAMRALESELKDVSKLTPGAHRLRQAREELTQTESELEDLRPKETLAADRVRHVEGTIADHERKLASTEASIKTNSYDSELHLKLVRMMDQSKRLDELKKKCIQLEKQHELKTKELSTARTEHAKATGDQKTAAGERAAFQKQAEADKKHLDRSLKKYGSADAIASLIEANKRLIADNRKKARIEQELRKLIDGRTERSNQLADIDHACQAARKSLDEFRAELESLKRIHVAEELRRGLKKGEPCPVCEHPVQRPPKPRKHPSIDSARAEVSRLEKEVTRLEKQSSAIEAEVGQLAPQVEDKKAQLVEVESLISEGESSISAILGKAPGPEAEAELNELREQIKALQEKANANVHRIDQLRKSETTASERARDCERRVSVLEAESAAAARELDQSRAEAQTLQKQLGEYADVTRAQIDLEKQEQARQEREELVRRKESDTQALSRAKDALADTLRARENVQTKITGLEKTRERLTGSIAELDASLKKSFADFGVQARPGTDVVSTLEDHIHGLEARRSDLQRQVSEHEQRTKLLAEQITRAAQLRSDLDQHRAEGAVARELAQALHGNHFIAFIQQEVYHRLAISGSQHLRTLSSGRYSFAVEEDDFVAVDHWNADDTRPVATLSGGESFLASLALALALAEGLSGLSHGSGRFALEALFLDEGFGSLDAETLDVVLQGVENLGTSDRLVGIVSHIPELAERMPVRINVRKSIGGSTIELS